MIYNMTEDGSNYDPVEEGEDIVKTLEKIKLQGGTTVYMLESGDFIGVDSCPACGKEATVEYDARYGYHCACSNPKCHMSMAGLYTPTAFATIHNWNGLCLAIDMSRAKGEVDESDMARIFGPIPDNPNVSDESGSESE